MDIGLTTLVINLDKDVERLKAISYKLSQEKRIELIRISGVPGDSLPHAARQALSYNSGWAAKAGEIGCFMSHVKAWEYIAYSSSPFCIVMEDDATPCGLHRLTEHTLPGGAELVFINDRMTVGLRTDSPDTPLTFEPVTASLPNLNIHTLGVGGDGYVLTNVGARKLLAAVATDLFYGHVDWRMLRYCVTPENLEGELNSTFVAGVIRTHHNPYRQPAWGILRAYCTNTPLVHCGVLSSSREAMTKATEAALARQHPA